MKVLATDRLNLRWLEPGDAAFILELLNTPSFLHYIGDRGVKTLEDGREYIIKGAGQSYAEHGFGLYLTELKEDPKPIGLCGLLKREALDDVDLGFALLETYWGQGYAFEAAQAVMVHAREEFGLERIVAITAPDNAASIRLLEKLGMSYETMVRLSDDAPAVKLFA